MQFVIRLIITIFFLFFHSISYGKTENAFYILHAGQKQIDALNLYLSTVNKHHQSIQLLIAQSYQIDENGLVSGFINQELVDLAKKHSIKLMTMVTNKGYDQTKIHQFLTSASAEQNAINSLISLCKQYHFDGVQFDFEMISINDKQALTQFYKNAALKLHQAGFRVSYAVIPAFINNMDASLFLRKTYQNWSGAYDLKALGESGDFVTIMAYNQHPNGTIPGPNASISYVKVAIQNALKEIPAYKVSLGIPAYSLYWYIGRAKIALHQEEISYSDANKIIKKNHSSLVWNKKDKINYATYERNWLDEYVYLEDVHSFKAKLALVKQFKLHGISLFRIGTEDNRIWGLLKKRNRLA